MADVSTITASNGTAYDIKDNTAVASITATDARTFTVTKRGGGTATFSNLAADLISVGSSTPSSTDCLL